ncbi:N-6 DNA methylase [Sporolactobacillus terrae]|uniref:N-6 DNA methylase n=1 Tax=Sporolactobacillus terrae TaxID=269673 RepID=UPI0005629965|nr:N-6 DNA methylase [Sporolactobacillus terrae]
MLTIQKINELMGISESFQASYKLSEIMHDEQRRNDLFEAFLTEEQDLSFDWFTEYFQAEQSDRKNKKQDFTPDGIVTLTSSLLGSTVSNADICAGTGGLTIKRWAENKNASFYCEEFSDRALPFLLFNLAVHNMNAVVRHGDSLTRNFKATYRLTKSDRFSEIELIDSVGDFKAQTVIMNPPYSLPWKPDKSYIDQPRFKTFGALAPKSKSDYAFLLEGLHQLDDNGTMAIILPHGVLFRGSAEQTIRIKLIELNLLDAVIGLPEKAFFSTDIPTVVLVLKKNRADKTILFIDASKECTKKAKNNVIEQQHIDKILDVYRTRKEVDKFSHIATLGEIKGNEFNLNIPRYVDTFEPEPVVPLDQIMAEMKEIDAQIAHHSQELSVMMNELVGTNPYADSEIKRFASFFSDRVNPNKKSRKRKDVTRGEQLSLL